MLAIRNLSKSYAGARTRTVLRNIQLDLAVGEYIAVMGESGIGKSTLLNLVAGLDKPDAGSIVVDGIELTTLDDDALTLLRRRSMGFVFQAFHILPYLNLAQNVALPPTLDGANDAQALARAGALLAAVGLAGRESSLPRELSGGELQRVAIARSLVHRPKLLLADEPTGNLDRTTGEEVSRLLEGLHANGMTLIIVTHDPHMARRAPRQLAMEDGLLRGDSAATP